MHKASACDCGYRPRSEDCMEHVVGVDEITNKATIVLHVICYACGAEWVE